MVDSQVTLYYLTGTGNSLKIARDIASGLNECALVSIPEAMSREKTIAPAGAVGLVFPVYYARPPVVVQEFIDAADFAGVSYLFAVADGGGLFGQALKILRNSIDQKGVQLDAGFIISMPGNHPKIASMQKTVPEEHFRDEAVRTEEIAEIVRNRQSCRIETNFGPMGWIFSHLAFRKHYRHSMQRRMDQYYWVDDSCDGCGICERICPVENIRIYQEKPVWQNGCINCIACYHACPGQSLQMGSMERMTNYRHPDITLEEIICMKN